jgi:hypothetical protein
LESLFFGRSLGQHVMAVIRAAFDASMDRPCGITSVAGYIGDAHAWQDVEERWLNRLNVARLDRFRLTDVLFEFGLVAGLQCAEEFARILASSQLRFINAYMLDTDWALLDKDTDYSHIYPRREHACLDMLLGVLAEEARLEFKGEPIAVAFDNDYGNTKMAARVYEAWRARTGHPGFQVISFIAGEQPWDFVPLQCADLVAGVVRQDPFSKDLLRASSERTLDAIDMASPVAAVARMAMSKGRGAMWSLSLAGEIEEILNRRRQLS